MPRFTVYVFASSTLGTNWLYIHHCVAFTATVISTIIKHFASVLPTSKLTTSRWIKSAKYFKKSEFEKSWCLCQSRHDFKLGLPARHQPINGVMPGRSPSKLDVWNKSIPNAWGERKDKVSSPSAVRCLAFSKKPYQWIYFYTTYWVQMWKGSKRELDQTEFDFWKRQNRKGNLKQEGSTHTSTSKCLTGCNMLRY